MANIWCRAVWKEGDHEEEEVSPTKWITDNYVHWPFIICMFLSSDFKIQMQQFCHDDSKTIIKNTNQM
jgi:hypothetical protein